MVGLVPNALCLDLAFIEPETGKVRLELAIKMHFKTNASVSLIGARTGGWPARAAARLLPFLLALFLGAMLATSMAWASSPQAPPEQQAVQEKLEGQRAVVDSVEAALGREGLRSVDLDELRSRLDPVRSSLSGGITSLEPLLANFNHRVQEIGPKPGDDAPPEDASITQERDALVARASDLDTVLKQARLLRVRADQVQDSITGRRRALFTDQLLARSYSILSPTLWIDAAAAVPVEAKGINYLLTGWANYANARMSQAGQIGVAFASLLIIVLVMGMSRVLARPLRRDVLAAVDEPMTQLRACVISLLTAILGIVAAPLATVAVIQFLNALDLLPARVADIAWGGLLSVVVVAVGRGLLKGALAPGEPSRRVVPLSDTTVSIVYRHVTVALWIVAIASLLHTIHRALVAPVALTVATSAVTSLLLVLVAWRAIRILNAENQDGDDSETGAADGTATAGALTAVRGGTAPATVAPDGGRSGDSTEVSARALQWVRLPLLLLNIAILSSLLAGYVSFASFLASRSVVAVVMGGTLYLVLALINAFFIDAIANDHRARRAAKTIGVRPASLELLSVLLAGLLKVMAVIAMLVIVVGTFGTSTADIQDLLSRATLGFTIGASTITVGDVLSALLFLILGIAAARAIQRWVAVAILPKTSLDPGLQNSIATIIGYVGAIAVIALTMGQIGLNLENIALVAGALSVGIGFGLQSIVSNFVSGLILLAERPIRVGDTINVKGEEGYVRRISVRATEIETFDRATVVIPNSDLITGMVKNFTHANTTGRVIVAVNVAYDADADEVRDILIGCACDHPQVLRSPPPRVFLISFGDSYLKFELRCVVANVDYALTVKSDLHFAVLDRLKAAKIGIPYTPWAVYRGGRIGADEPEKPDDGASQDG